MRCLLKRGKQEETCLGQVPFKEEVTDEAVSGWSRVYRRVQEVTCLGQEVTDEAVSGWSHVYRHEISFLPYPRGVALSRDTLAWFQLTKCHRELLP